MYGLYTGSLLTPGAITILYGKFLAASSGNVLVALLLLCLASVILTYGVYGLRRGGLHNIITSGGGVRDSTYYKGLPMWFMLLAYLSLATYMIATAVSQVMSDPGYVSRSAWRWKDADNVPLFLGVALFVVAAWLDSAIKKRNIKK